ncbi:helix-loop-helix domain-containing protein [Cohnella sp. GCM10012308]|uniref:helix-loop-helix domain-containing protein n=1 Tax=Cohnella sp. GCM10012308 TaxID=3317329 RepID=UPI003617A9B9
MRTRERASRRSTAAARRERRSRRSTMRQSFTNLRGHVPQWPSTSRGTGRKTTRS